MNILKKSIAIAVFFIGLGITIVSFLGNYENSFTSAEASEEVVVEEVAKELTTAFENFEAFEMTFT